MAKLSNHPRQYTQTNYGHTGQVYNYLPCQYDNTADFGRQKVHLYQRTTYFDISMSIQVYKTSFIFQKASRILHG